VPDSSEGVMQGFYTFCRSDGEVGHGFSRLIRDRKRSIDRGDSGSQGGTEVSWSV
jgi:hypothetical protein